MIESTYQADPKTLDPVAIRAAVESDRQALQRTNGDGQVTRLSRKLEREVIPWTKDDFTLGRGGLSVVANPDPILRYIMGAGEEEWRKMEIDSRVALGKAKRVNYLLSFGTELTKPQVETAANKILWEAVLLSLQSIQRFGLVQKAMLDAIFWGWRPFEIEWKQVRFKGRLIWVPRHVREKYPEDFGFTTDRELVWQPSGGFGEEQRLTKKSDRFKYFTVSAGSNDNPYGVGVYRGIWDKAFLKGKFEAMLCNWYQRAIGIVVLETTDSNQASKFQENQTGQVVNPKTARELMRETQVAIQAATGNVNETGVLVQKPGQKIAMDAQVKGFDGWMSPIEYCNAEIELVLTGQTLTSEIKGNGSRAAAETHKEVLHTYAKSDSKEVLEPGCNDELIARFLELNFGEVDPADVPKLRSKIGSQVSLESAKTLYDMGAPIDGSRVAQDAGVPLAPDGDEPVVLQKADPMELAQQKALPFGEQPPTKKGEKNVTPPQKKEKKDA